MAQQNITVGKAGFSLFLPKLKTSDIFIGALNKCIAKYGINQSSNALCHFLAQCAHESVEFKFTHELASGTDYEGRKTLGNTQPGDGPRFKGVDYIQLTGRRNYAAFADHVGDPKVMIGWQYVELKYEFLPSGYWWQINNMNQLIAWGATPSQVSRMVNRGNLKSARPSLGEAQRIAYYQRARQVWP